MASQHDLIAKYVAATRFPFPDQNLNPGNHGLWPKDYVTIVNTEKKQRGVQFNDKTWYPDIVIVNSKNEVRELGEVENEEDLVPAVLAKWRGYAAAASIGPQGYPKLFIYVPASKLEQAQKIIDGNSIRYAGLRAYEISDDLNTLKLSVIITNEL